MLKWKIHLFQTTSTTSQLNSILGPKQAKIGKYIEMCMENDQKIA